MNEKDQHPLLFGYIVKETIILHGAEGRRTIQKAVRMYGTRRGRRMAERARKNRYDNDLLGYLLFGEFDLSEVGNAYSIITQEPSLEIHMTQCFWHRTWEENDLLDFGRFYCQDIDKSILRGFNELVRFDAYDRFTTCSEMCRFVYHDWPFTGTIAGEYMEKSNEIQKIALRSWPYHTADLYQALSQSISEDYGQAGEEALNRGILKFTEKFGKQASLEIKRMAKDIDFNAL